MIFSRVFFVLAVIAATSVPVRAQSTAAQRQAWYGMDKVGHALTSYALSDIVRRSAEGAGISPMRARAAAVLATLAAGAAKEVLVDGRGSSLDMSFNLVGIAAAFRVGKAEEREVVRRRAVLLPPPPHASAVVPLAVSVEPAPASDDSR